MSRSSRHLLLAAMAGLAAVALTPAAQAGGYGPDRYGPDRYSGADDSDWSSAEDICRSVEADETRCHWSGSESRVEGSESRVEERRVVEDGRVVEDRRYAERDRLADDGRLRPALYEEVNVPESFFVDEGGVGPAFADSGGSSGGGYVFAGGGAFAGASASASARVSVGVSIHGGGFFHFDGRPPMHGGGGGCGCGGGGGRHW